MKRLLQLFLMQALVALSVVFAQGNSEAPKGKFSGYMFGDYYYNIARDGAFSNLANAASSGSAPGTKGMQAFQFRRIYFAYDNDISQQFTTRFQLEADQTALLGATGDVLTSGRISVFVKDAYLKWKNVFSGSDLIFGIQPTPAYDISEAAWGYRSLEKTIMDLRGIVDSRDLGLTLRGNLAGDGTVNYWLLVGNGAGTSKLESDKYKRYYAHVQVKPATNLQATLYVDYKDAANVLDANKNSVSHGTLTTALFVGYAEPSNYSLGLEGFLVSQSNAYTPPGGSLGSKTGIGITAFGSYFIQSDLVIVGRYDCFDPNSDGNSKGDARNYIIAALDWKANKNVSIMANLLFETYEAPTGGTAPDASVTARLTFYYVFL